MSYEVINGNLYGCACDRHHPHDASTVAEAVTDALDVLRAAWGPDAVATEYGVSHDGDVSDYDDRDSALSALSDWQAVGYDAYLIERTVARSSWRKVEAS